MNKEILTTCLNLLSAIRHQGRDLLPILADLLAQTDDAEVIKEVLDKAIGIDLNPFKKQTNTNYHVFIGDTLKLQDRLDDEIISTIFSYSEETKCYVGKCPNDSTIYLHCEQSFIP